VTLQLKWKHQFQFAGFYMAKEKGFYDEVGINVDIQEYQDGIILDDVLSGKSTFGIDDSQLVYYKLSGKNIVGLFATFQDSPLAIMSNKKIEKIQDLNNHEIQFSKNALHNISMKAMLLSNGVNIKTTELKHKVRNILEGKVDAISGYLSNELFLIKQNGMEYNIYHPRDYGFNFYGDILFTTKQNAQNNPELMYNFTEATKKGWEYVFENIDETIEVIMNKYNTQNKSKEWLLYEYEVLKDFNGGKESFGELKQDKIVEIGKIISLLLPNKYNTHNLEDFIWDNNEELLKHYKDDYFRFNNTFKVCVNHDFMPIDGIKDGKVSGITGDVLDKISKELDITFLPIHINSREERSLKTSIGGCDVISMSTSFSKDDNMKPSKKFLSGHFSIISNLDIPFLSTDEKIIKNKKYITRYSSYATYLKQLYPDIDISIKESIQESLEMVKDRKVDGFIVDYITADRVIQDFGYGKYKISGFLALENPIRGGFAVIDSKPELLKAINIVLGNMSRQEIENIKEKWSLARYTQVVDNNLIWKTVAVFAVLLSILSLVAFVLKVHNKNLKKQIALEIEKNINQQAIMFQQARFAEMGEMISMITHQWRQPLNHISILINNLFLKYKIDKLNEDIVSDIKKQFQQNIVYMSKTIDDFQNFFKPQQQKEKFFIIDLVNDTLLLIKPLFDRKKITFDIQIDENISYYGYKSELGQVILNILNNAKDAFLVRNIEDKYIKIQLVKTSDEILCILIEDNAGGIPNDIINKVFDPYFSTKSSKNGTGLGLYIAKIIITDHFKGKINAENIDKGVKFEILLPIL
jgi:signal transduction histidine kinase/ABC-type nitrate/sulfonate/bicarbonate transport system substrate-binding protein